MIVAARTVGRENFNSTPPLSHHGSHATIAGLPTPFSRSLILESLYFILSLRVGEERLSLCFCCSALPTIPHLPFPPRCAAHEAYDHLSLSLPLLLRPATISHLPAPSRCAVVSPCPFPTRSRLPVDFPLHFTSPSLAEIDSALPSSPRAPLRRPFSISFSLLDGDTAVSLTQQPAFHEKLPHKLPIEASARWHPSFAAF